MPNLDTIAAQDWLSSLQPGSAQPDWPPPIRAIEEPADHAAALAWLGQELDGLASNDSATVRAILSDTDGVEDMRTLLCQLGAARLLSLMHFLSENTGPGDGPIQLILSGTDTPEALALRSALKTLSRRFTLHRMFSPERLSALRAATSEASKETVQ